MPAHNGNRYAEKWTVESTLAALEKINRFAMMDDTLYLGMALARAGYYDDIWRYWRKKWARHYAIMHEMKLLMQHFEAQIFAKTAGGKIPVRLGMFALQHHYGWCRESAREDELVYIAEDDKRPPHPATATADRSATADKLSEGEGSNTSAAMPVQISPNADERRESKGAIAMAEDVTEDMGMEDEEYVVMTAEGVRESGGTAAKLPSMNPARERTLQKLARYNMEHHMAPLRLPLAWYAGVPPVGCDAVVYEGGYFVSL